MRRLSVLLVVSLLLSLTGCASVKRVYSSVTAAANPPPATSEEKQELSNEEFEFEKSSGADYAHGGPSTMNVGPGAMNPIQP